MPLSETPFGRRSAHPEVHHAGRFKAPAGLARTPSSYAFHVGKPSLSQTHPDLAAQADDWDPDTVTSGSSKMLWWVDQHGHRWQARVNSRTGPAQQGCPYCSGKRALPGQTDLATTHPALAAEAEAWDPTQVKAHSNRKLSWRCALGHVWQATPNNRAKGTGCPICSGRQVLAGYNDLATLRPDIAKEADGWDPATVTIGSRQRVWWRCAEGHRWKVAVSDRVATQGCAVCSGHKVLAGHNDLATTHPELALEIDQVNPPCVSAGSSTELQWRCAEGHTWRARVSHRVRGTGCPTCANKQIAVGFNDLATTHPELAKQADGWDPTTVGAGSGRTQMWRCDLGHTWLCRIDVRSDEETGCPTCANRVIAAGFNDLATTHPELAMEANGWDPTSVGAGSNSKVAWRCQQGHEWTALIISRTRDRRGCPYCSGRLVVPGHNDLATLHPLLAAELIGVDPSTVHAGSKQRLSWRCAQGHVWMAQVSSRTRATSPTGCPGCAPRGGFDSTLPGYLYLVEHEMWGLLQVGISNTPERRLTAHQRRGWVVLDVRGPMEGLLARAWEQDILEALRDIGADVGTDAIAGKFDGYTESWRRETYPVKRLSELFLLTEG